MMKNALVFENFKLLKRDMEDNDWVMDAFIFVYKNINYIVVVKRFLENEKKPPYALLKTEFMKADDHNYNITILVNSSGFMTDPKTLRMFFNIDFAKNVGELLQQFNQYFSGFIPTKVNSNKSKSLTQVLISSLSRSDSEDPNKIYCFTVRRNPDNRQRSLFNDNKTKLLRPSLYMKFKEDPTISFCYSQNSNEECTDEEIFLKFSQRI
ncbi:MULTISPECIES: DUF6037 family protein [Elizabethkingia]|uniref:DUF6037 family protein n=1 Tax=Elizabethkingia TaxID=308865 RepID=UPI001F4AB5EC|nr:MULTISPECIES: DUF6037 family protein [Elizabethkingia]